MTSPEPAEAGIPELLGRRPLPSGFERWTLRIEPGTERPTTAGEWAGALVLVETGRLEVDCLAGGHRTFRAGDLLALGWLPLSRLRNAGDEPVRLIAVRRRDERSGARYLVVTRGLRGGNGVGGPDDRDNDEE